MLNKCPLLSLFCSIFFQNLGTNLTKHLVCHTHPTCAVAASGYLNALTFPLNPLFNGSLQTGHLSDWYECVLTSAGHRDWGHFPWLFQLHSLLQGAESTMNVILLVLSGRVLSVRPLAFNHVELWMCYQSHCLPWSCKGWITGTFFELDFKVDHAISPTTLFFFFFLGKVYSQSLNYLKIGQIIRNNICSL